MSYIHVVQLEIIFNADFEYLTKDFSKITKALCRRHWRLEHAKRALTLAVMTTEPPDRLLDRLRPVLDNIYSVTDYWCHMAPTVVVAKHGEMDPTRTLLKEAWGAARAANHAKYLQKAQG